MKVLNERNENLKMVMDGKSEKLFEIEEKEFSELVLEEYKREKGIK